MLPVVRPLISIPAGIARMHLGRFVVFTGLGALVWCTILTWIGWFIGSREDVILEVLNQEARRYAGRAVLVVLPVLAGIAAIYIWWYRRRAAQGRQGEGLSGWHAPPRARPPSGGGGPLGGVAAGGAAPGPGARPQPARPGCWG